MAKFNVLELLQQDIEDIKGLMHYEEDGITEEVMKNQARAIILNLQEHLEELIKSWLINQLKKFYIKDVYDINLS